MLQGVSFLQVSPPKPYMNFYSHLRVLHALPITLALVWSVQYYLAGSTGYEACGHMGMVNLRSASFYCMCTKNLCFLKLNVRLQFDSVLR